MSFDLEIRNSISSLQAQVASLTQQTDRAQASLARMGTQAKVTAGQTFEISKNMEKIGATASAAGGPVAGLMTKMGGLAMFNPVALAAGAAIGALTSGVVKLTDALREAADERERLASPIGTAATREAIGKAQGELDPERLRASVSPGVDIPGLEAAGVANVSRWIADLPDWARPQSRVGARIRAEVAGKGLLVTAADRQAQLAADLSMRGRAARSIEQDRTEVHGYLDEIEAAAIAREAGATPRPLSTGAAEHILRNSQSPEAEELRKIEATLRELLQEQRRTSRQATFRGRQSDTDAAIAELSARKAQIIQAHTMTQESSQ